MYDSTEAPIRLVLVDDHPMWLESLRRRFRKTPGFEVLGVAQDGATALELVAARRPTILVLDVGPPDMSGVEVARQVHARWPEVMIFVLTGYALATLPHALWTIGIAGALVKTADWPAIRAALQAVAHGYCILPAALARRSPRGRELGLTPREQSVLELLVAGHRNAEIARALHITERTVESHVTHVLAKLGVHSRVQAVRCAQEHGLVDTSRPGPQPR